MKLNSRFWNNTMHMRMHAIKRSLENTDIDWGPSIFNIILSNHSWRISYKYFDHVHSILFPSYSSWILSWSLLISCLFFFFYYFIPHWVYWVLFIYTEVNLPGAILLKEAGFPLVVISFIWPGLIFMCS